jgi:hypothetical protein
LNRHYSHDHAGEKRNRSVVPYLKLFQTLGYGGRQEARIPEEESIDEAGQRAPRDEEAMQPRHDGERTNELPITGTGTESTPTWSRQSRIGIRALNITPGTKKEGIQTEVGDTSRQHLNVSQYATIEPI